MSILMFNRSNKNIYLINAMFLPFLVYLYLLHKIFNNYYEFVFLCFSFLLFGYFFIKNNIFTLLFIIIIFDIIKTYFYRENNENKIDNMIEDEKEDSDKDDYNVIEFEDDDKKKWKMKTIKMI